MTQEEKAKRYDSVSKEVKDFFEGKQQMYSDITKALEYLFPELRESKDEKIRKELIQYLKDYPNLPNGQYCRDDFFVWLEKQGEQKPTKPKFHEGEWITNGDYTWKIIEVKPLDYILQSQDGNIVDDTISHVDEQFHSWTIQEATPGDVIYLPNGDEYYLFIFKGIENAAVMSFAHFYQYCDGTSEVKGAIDSFASVNDIFQPSTKEQQDTFERAITNAGYRWDAEKKEFSVSSEEDEKIRKELINYFRCIAKNGDTVWTNLDYDKVIDWLEKQGQHKFKVGDEIETANEKSLTITKIDDKGYWSEDLFICSFNEECCWNLVEPKSVWSEKDEKILGILTAGFEDYDEPDAEWWKGLKVRECIEWFKSLKDKVQLQNTITDEEIAQAKREAYNDALNKIEYHGDEPTFDDGWGAAIWYLRKRNIQPQSKQEWSEKDEDYINDLIEYFSQNERLKNTKEDIVIWLKSLMEA